MSFAHFLIYLQVKCHTTLYAIPGVQILESMVICISKWETIFVVSYFIKLKKRAIFNLIWAKFVCLI